MSDKRIANFLPRRFPKANDSPKIEKLVAALAAALFFPPMFFFLACSYT